jgi:uncharacterized Zn-finger protein
MRKLLAVICFPPGKLDINTRLDTILALIQGRDLLIREGYVSTEIKVTETIASCSDNGQHPLVYINLKNGEGSCQYCGKRFVRVNDAQAKEVREGA